MAGHLNPEHARECRRLARDLGMRPDAIVYWYAQIWMAIEQHTTFPRALAQTWALSMLPSAFDVRAPEFRS